MLDPNLPTDYHTIISEEIGDYRLLLLERIKGMEYVVWLFDFTSTEVLRAEYLYPWDNVGVSKGRYEKEAKAKFSELKNALEVIVQDTKKVQNDPRIICPLCKSPMVQRNGQFGIFYACSSWTPEHRCPATVSSDGKLSLKTRSALAMLRKANRGNQKDQAVGKTPTANRAKIVDLDD